MKMKSRLALVVVFALLAVRAEAADLKIQVYTSTEGLNVTSTIITGDTEAMVVDPQFRLSDAHRVAALVLETGKRLTMVYSTHPHPDHYFGLAVLHPAFPDAKLLALPVVVKGIEASWDARYNFWKPTYGDNIPARHVIPQALDTDTLMLDGQEIKIIGLVQGDSPGDNSYVWIPSIKAIIGGDILFGNMHMPLGGLTSQQRADWLQVINDMIALKPEIVVAGHEGPGTKHDASILTRMKAYLEYFDEARAASKTPEELEAKLQARFPDGTDTVSGMLKFSSEAAFR